MLTETLVVQDFLHQKHCCSQSNGFHLAKFRDEHTKTFKRPSSCTFPSNKNDMDADEKCTQIFHCNVKLPENLHFPTGQGPQSFVPPPPPEPSAWTSCSIACGHSWGSQLFFFKNQNYWILVSTTSPPLHRTEMNCRTLEEISPNNKELIEITTSSEKIDRDLHLDWLI